MGIQNFPAALQPLIQQNFLEREFQDGLESTLGFREVADREDFAIKVGETVTKTRSGLKAPVEAPMAPANNTNLDNGLTPSGWTVEQYTLSLGMYGDTMDLNMVTQKVGIADQFLKNAKTNGTQAKQSLDRIARNTLFAAYMTGNTRVRVTLGAPAATLAVDDINGFLMVFNAQNQQVPVSSANPLPVTVGGGVYSLVGAAADAVNISTTPKGVSGTLTFSGNVSVADGTAGNAVVHLYAPTVLRPNSRATTAALTSADTLTMSLLLDAVTVLNNNAVPHVKGLFNCYLDPTSARQLFADPEFQRLFRGTGVSSSAFKLGEVVEILSCRIIQTTEAYQQKLGGVKIHRPIIVGEGALVEGDFAGLASSDVKPGDSMVEVVDGIAMVTREPLDRLKQIIAQSWYWIGGFAVPTDVTANQTIIPTATSSYYKRAVMLEVGG
jgi:N4-gp56 family major capsid protein